MFTFLIPSEGRLQRLLKFTKIGRLQQVHEVAIILYPGKDDKSVSNSVSIAKFKIFKGSSIPILKFFPSLSLQAHFNSGLSTRGVAEQARNQEFQRAGVQDTKRAQWKFYSFIT